MEIPSNGFEQTAIAKLSRDLRNAAKLMSPREARYFVNTYYDLQDYRIRSANQQRKLLEGQEPSEFMTWLLGNLETLDLSGGPPMPMPMVGGAQPVVGDEEPSLQELEAAEDEAKIMDRISRACGLSSMTR